MTEIDQLKQQFSDAAAREVEKDATVKALQEQLEQLKILRQYKSATAPGRLCTIDNAFDHEPGCKAPDYSACTCYGIVTQQLADTHREITEWKEKYRIETYRADTWQAHGGSVNKLEKQLSDSTAREAELRRVLDQHRQWLDDIAQALLNKPHDGYTYVPGTLAQEIKQMREQHDQHADNMRKLRTALGKTLCQCEAFFEHCGTNWSHARGFKDHVSICDSCGKDAREWKFIQCVRCKALDSFSVQAQEKDTNAKV